MAEQPSPGKRFWTEEKVEQVVGNLLRAGVLVSAAVVAVGAAVYLAHHGSEPPHYRTFRGEPETLRSVPLMLQALLEGSGRGIIQVGLLLLLATPVARVAMSAFAFSRQRDWLYVAVSFIVLTILAVSLLGLTQ